MLRFIAALGLLLGTSFAQAEIHRVAAEVTAALPHDASWARLRNFSVAHLYVPGLSRTEIVSAQQEGLGAHRRVYDEDGDYLEETIIAWREGVGFDLRLHQGEDPMMPFDSITFTYAIQPSGASQTRIGVALVFEMPWGWLGDYLAEWFIVPAMEDNLVQVAAGMKHYYETGQPASDADRQREAAAVQILPAAVAH